MANIRHLHEAAWSKCSQYGVTKWLVSKIVNIVIDEIYNNLVNDGEIDLKYVGKLKLHTLPDGKQTIVFKANPATEKMINERDLNYD